jgi:hypothetical protein
VIEPGVQAARSLINERGPWMYGSYQVIFGRRPSRKAATNFAGYEREGIATHKRLNATFDAYLTQYSRAIVSACYKLRFSSQPTHRASAWRHP